MLSMILKELMVD